MEISIVITVPDDFSAEDLGNVLIDAGQRCGDQIHQEILKHPMKVDEAFSMGSDYEEVEVTLTRID